MSTPSSNMQNWMRRIDHVRFAKRERLSDVVELCFRDGDLRLTPNQLHRLVDGQQAVPQIVAMGFGQDETLHDREEASPCWSRRRRSSQA